MKRNRFPRGAAAVETAVTTIVLVPLILYTLFLEDMLAYKLENQEPTIAAGWDYNTNDYMTGKGLEKGYGKAGKDKVTHLNRLKYCDHSSGYDSYDPNYDCNDDVHHNATAAHQCWIIAGAEQVDCTVSSNDYGTFTDGQVALYNQTWNKGGPVTCTAKLGVMNYMLPNKVWGLMGMQKLDGDKGQGNTRSGGENGRVGMTSKGRFRDDKTFEEINKEINTGESRGTDHPDATGPDAAKSSWILKQEEFAVMSDSWALNDIKEIKPSEGSPITSFISPGSMPGTDIFHPLLDRSGHYYNKYMKDGNDAADSYFDSMKDYLQDSMLFGANMDGLGPLGGDKPGSLPVFWNKNVQRSNNSGFASGYADSRQSAPSQRQADKYPW